MSCVCIVDVGLSADLLIHELRTHAVHCVRCYVNSADGSVKTGSVAECPEVLALRTSTFSPRSMRLRRQIEEVLMFCFSPLCNTGYWMNPSSTV
jgi:hypothetical protein